MAIPSAIVKVELLTIKGLPAATPGPGNTRYARATFQAGANPPFFTGRTRPIPDAGGDFDLTPEAVPWSWEVAIEPGTDISIEVDLLEDKGENSIPAAIALAIAANTINGKISDPWKSGPVTLGSGPTIAGKVTTKLVKPTDAAFLSRAAAAAGKSGALTIPQALVVQFTSIDGLYEPDSSATPPTPGSKKVAGYISQDNLGRVFTNRTPDGAWLRETQFMDVAVQVTAINGAALPAAAKITWTLTDVDDPTNDDPDFHREWGHYVDPNDYDAAGNPIGAHAGDNTNAFSGDVFASPPTANGDPNNLFPTATQGTKRWAQATGGPVPSASSADAAESPITITNPTTATSSVRIHCPTVGGTNFVLTAGVKDGPAGVPVFKAVTGVITMWSRIDVEVRRMPSAHTLSGVVPQIAPFFVPARVQMDVQLEQSVAAAFDIEQLAGNNEDLEDDKTREWINNVFVNKAKPGWFFLGAARFASIKAGGGGPAPVPLYNDTNYTLGLTGPNPSLEVPGDKAADGRLFTTAVFVVFDWTDASGTALRASFGADTVTSAGGKTKIILVGNDFTPEFTGHDADGTWKHATQSRILLFPQHTFRVLAGVMSAGGFGIPAAGAKVRLFAPGATFTGGISPGIKKNDKTFAGRTVVFTSAVDPALVFDVDVLQTVVHELVHTFGMPHKCGYWDWHTGRTTSCCMNYFNTWLADTSPAHNLIPGKTKLMGNDMCGRHLMEVRRVHMEQNKALKW